jgi:hypothetical protein
MVIFRVCSADIYEMSAEHMRRGYVASAGGNLLHALQQILLSSPQETGHSQ